MVAPFARGDISLCIEGKLVSAPYVAMTLAMLERFGLEFNATFWPIHIFAPQRPTPLERYVIEPDASAASYFFAAAAITGGPVTVQGFPDGEPAR